MQATADSVRAYTDLLRAEAERSERATTHEIDTIERTIAKFTSLVQSGAMLLAGLGAVMAASLAYFGWGTVRDVRRQVKTGIETLQLGAQSAVDTEIKTPLAELAALSGMPAKIGGIDGSQVEAMVAAGRLEELAAYCDTDVFVTYILFLRFSLVTGGINLNCYTSSLEKLHQHIADRVQKRPHLEAYLRVLESMMALEGNLRIVPGDKSD